MRDICVGYKQRRLGVEWSHGYVARLLYVPVSAVIEVG